MPAFNVDAYIGEAIESVLTQSVSDWELIVVDDGSTDGTAEIVRGFKDPRIRIFQQENAGISAARNRGIRESCGKFIAFFDSDDRLRPEAIERLSGALEKTANACVAYGEWIVMNEEGVVFGSNRGPVFSPRPSGNVLRIILQKNFIMGGAVLVRTGCLLKTDGFNNDLPTNQDWDMWCRLATIGEFIYIGRGPVMEYRFRRDSITRTSLSDISKRLHCIDAVYGNPEIKKFFTERELIRLRRKREASFFSKIGAEYLKSRNWQQARHYFLESLRRKLLSPREIILLAVAVMRRLPSPIERRIK